MRRGFFFVGRVLVMLLIVLPLLALAVHGLWNWLMPAIFGLHAITYLQAFGLLVLSWILFRGPRMGPRMRPRGWMMRRRWEKMTPEQREEMRRRWQARCGGVVAPQA